LAWIIGLPFSPIRGDLNALFNWCLTFVSVLSMIVFLMFSVDSTRLCERFVLNIGNLAEHDALRKTRWPGIAFENEGYSGNLGRESRLAIAEYLDVRMIANRTAVIQDVVVWSGAVILLMAAARVSIFDHWNIPLPLIAAYLLGFVYVVVSIYLMQKAAVRVRDRALLRLRERQLVAKSKGLKSTELIGSVIERIENIHDGAFATFFSNPVWQALLIPSGGLSLLTLAEYMLSNG
jgi:hypothetical protein